MVSIAGIGANLIIAIVSFTVFKILLVYGIFNVENTQEGFGKIFVTLFLNLIFLNVSLAIFNLLPFPPLDGSNVLSTFLPARFQPILDMMEQYGFLILMALIYFGLIRIIMVPVFAFVYYLLAL